MQPSEKVSPPSAPARKLVHGRRLEAGHAGRQGQARLRRRARFASWGASRKATQAMAAAATPRVVPGEMRFQYSRERGGSRLITGRQREGALRLRAKRSPRTATNWDARPGVVVHQRWPQAAKRSSPVGWPWRLYQ